MGARRELCLSDIVAIELGVKSANDSPAVTNAKSDTHRSILRYSAPQATAAKIAEIKKGNVLPALSDSLPAGMDATVTAAQFEEFRRPICCGDMPLEFSRGPITVVTVDIAAW